MEILIEIIAKSLFGPKLIWIFFLKNFILMVKTKAFVRAEAINKFGPK